MNNFQLLDREIRFLHTHTHSHILTYIDDEERWNHVIIIYKEMADWEWELSE